MSGKKPGSKTSKLKKPAIAKAAPRRVEARKGGAASRKAVAASAASPPPKPSKKSEHEPHGASGIEASSAAPEPGTHSRLPLPRKGAGPAAPGPTIASHTITSALVSRVRALHDADEADGDGSEPGSLLAGPRNVKPYVAKRGEQYMSKEQLTHFQQILLTWKRDLMEEVDRTVSHMKDEAANFPDPNDRATQEEEFSLELRTRDRERKLIRKIEEALKRIEDGTYGYCLETGEEIGIKRLEARPVATLSIEAQERRERRERQYGERDDRYR